MFVELLRDFTLSSKYNHQAIFYILNSLNKMLRDTKTNKIIFLVIKKNYFKAKKPNSF